jgi:hypothetical protein
MDQITSMAAIKEFFQRDDEFAPGGGVMKRIVFALGLVLVGCSSSPPPAPTPPAPVPQEPKPWPVPQPPAFKNEQFCVPVGEINSVPACAIVCISNGWAFGDCADPKPCARVVSGRAMPVLVLEPEIAKALLEDAAEEPTIEARPCPRELES